MLFPLQFGWLSLQSFDLFTFTTKSTCCLAKLCALENFSIKFYIMLHNTFLLWNAILVQSWGLTVVIWYKSGITWPSVGWAYVWIFFKQCHWASAQGHTYSQGHLVHLLPEPLPLTCQGKPAPNPWALIYSSSRPFNFTVLKLCMRGFQM